MKILSIFVILNFSLFGADDVVMRAMRDELERSMRKLQLENLQKPYFVAYRAVEIQNCNISASFGALLTSYCEPPTSGEARSATFRLRFASATMRVTIPTSSFR